MRKEGGGQALTLQFLEKKYQQEKQILLRENKRLKQSLDQQVERADLLKIKSDELQRQNQSLNALITQLRTQIEQSRQNQSAKEAHFQLMSEYQSTIKQYKALLNEKTELQSIMEKIYNQKIELEKELEDFRTNQHELQIQMENLAEKHSQFKTESTKQIEQLQFSKKSLQQQVDKANTKSSEQKKKTKQLERKMLQLQRRLQINQDMEERKFSEQLAELRSERDKFYQKNLELSTKCSLFESKISQMERHQEQLQDDLKTSERKTQAEIDKNYEHRNKIEKLQRQIGQLEEEIEKLKEQNKQLQNQKNTVPKQDFMKQMRKNLTDINQISHKNLQRIGQGPTLRDYPSQSQFGVFIKQDDGLEKAKLENQINTLESELISYKRQVEILTDELRKIKRNHDDKHHDFQRMEIQLKEMKQKLEREAERGKELLALRKENQMLKGKQTQMIERAKEVAEYETSMSLKLAFYERKIKENLDSIDRKESIIEKHKITLCQMEEREKHYEEALKKLNDQVQSLKGYKQECNRKDAILKEYKAKNQKMKQQKEQFTKQIAKLKADVSKHRNDKQRCQTQLQIKEKQLSSLKLKYQKISSEKTEQYYKQNARLKQNKSANDHKIKQLKKQKEELSQELQQIKSIIISKVEEYIAKQIPPGKKKGHEYEAAKLLGLKAGDLEQFLNPGVSMNRRITVELQQLWMEGNYIQFTNSFVDYIVKQAEKKEPQT